MPTLSGLHREYRLEHRPRERHVQDFCEHSKVRRARRQVDEEFKTSTIRLVLDEGKAVGAFACGPRYR
jgi:hypothetical protein